MAANGFRRRNAEIKMKSLKPFLGPLIAFLLIAAAAAALEGLTFPWPGWKLAYCYPTCFCEIFRPGGVVQPLSSYSNLFYIFLGLFIVGSRKLPAPSGRSNLMTRRPGYITGFGVAVVAIGLTSLFYHVSLTQAGRWLDYMGMYGFVGYALIYSLARFRRWSGKTFAALYTLFLAALGLLWLASAALARPMLGALILAVIVVEAAVHRVRHPLQIKIGFLVASLGCFFLALAVNLLDESGALCAPASLWQWHAAWHFLTAVSTGLLYLYYRSEVETPANNP
jgi:hypothetical protein